MKNNTLILSIVALIATGSLCALEKPATPDVDYETYKIEKLRGENPDINILKKKLTELRERIKKETGKALEKTKKKIKAYEAVLESKIKAKI